MTQIICNGGNVVRYDFEDGANVEIKDDCVVTDGFVVGDLHSGNRTHYTDVTLPVDYVVSKYCYDGADWSLNLNYTEPEE